MKQIFSAVYRNRNWILPLNILLLLGVLVTFPFAIGGSWAWGSNEVDHTLIYTENKLEWGNDTSIREDGSAELSLFKDGLIAPGMLGGNTVRLINRIYEKITYTAVVYEIKSNEELPVYTLFTVEGARPTESYTLPEGVPEDAVISAVTGTVFGRQTLDMDIEWHWDFESGVEQDILDTALGNKEELDDVTVGIYITVVDDNFYSDFDPDRPRLSGHVIEPTNPDTGAENLLLWIAAAVLSFMLLILLAVSDRIERQKQH